MRNSVLGLIAAATVCGPLASAHAQRTPGSFADLVEDVMPAVVNISTSQAVTGFGAAPAGPDAVSLGSGFIVTRDGYVVTNGHVIENSDTITVTLEGGEEFPATLRGVDRETDLAVLKIETDRRLPAVDFGSSDRLRVGDWVVAIGQPFGLGGSVSAGIVSARNRDIDTGLYDDFIQTDAAINRGNSGGPLFDMDGDVVGVNTIIYSQTGGSVGVGFAIPAALAEGIVRQLIEYGETQRGYLGVLLEDVTAEDQTRLGASSTRGALVAGIPSTGGPAGIAGIQTDDIIVRFNGREIESSRDLTRVVADTQVGTSVPVVVMRDGRRVTLTVVLARRETSTALRRPGTIEMAGMTLSSATTETKALYGLPDTTEGVIVSNVDPRSPLANEVRTGDVILEMGWEVVRDAEMFEQQYNRLQTTQSGPVQLLVQRGDRLFYTHINP